MAKKPTKTKIENPAIMPGIEPRADQFLQAAVDAGFKFPAGTDIAHVSAMQLSTATSLKRIADFLENLLNERNSNTPPAQLRDIAVSLRQQNEMLAKIFDLLLEQDKDKTQPGELLPDHFFGEGPDGAGGARDFLDLGATPEVFGNGPRKSVWERFLDRVAPRTGRPIYPSEK